MPSIRGFVHERRRWVALIVVCFAMLMNTLDQTIVNVALPTIQRDLHFTQASLAWVIDAYLITFAGALLLAGRLGDLIGRKKVFLVGVALFTLASVACGAADTQAMLIGARFAQGLGAALSSSVILAIIVADFPVPAERAKAMSSYIIVAVGRRVAGPPGRGVGDPGPELALDLLHQHPDRHRHLRGGDDADRRQRRTGDPVRPRRRRGRAEHRRADARRLRHRQLDRVRLELDAHPGVRRRSGRRARRLPPAREPADPSDDAPARDEGRRACSPRAWSGA